MFRVNLNGGGSYALFASREAARSFCKRHRIPVSSIREEK